MNKYTLVLLLSLLLIGCSEQLPPEVSDPSQPDIAVTQILDPSPAPTEAALPSPESSPLTRPSKVDPSELTILERTVRDLALRLKLDLNAIKVVAMERIVWPNAGLGCPLAGLDYAQVETPGYRITLEAEGALYIYHTNTEMVFLLCEEGTPQLPLIPVIPGEIDDGEPWMPVDPLPSVEDSVYIADPDPVK